MTQMWLIIFVALIFLELHTINLVSIWFAIGSLASFFVSLCVEDMTIQVAVFVGVSLLSLLLTRNFVKKIKSTKIEKTNLDRVIGKVGYVTEDITKLNPGEVKVDGKKWAAISEKEIPAGKSVEILEIDGVKLVVKEIDEL